MNIPYYHIDAFTSSVFAGNPAGVCLLEEWLDDDTLRSIAAENNLSETAFLVSDHDGRHLRWFSPQMEIDLCGHATLATAFVLFSYVEPSLREVSFVSRAGLLTVTREADLLVLDFPSRRPEPCASVPEGLIEAVGALPLEVLRSVRDYFMVYPDERTVRGLRPDVAKLATAGEAGIIVTARGTACDFVSRFFAPGLGVPEDPVTGSAHCTLTPYWAERLGRTELHALQVSERGGELFCAEHGDRTHIGGRAVAYLQGSLSI